MHVLFLFLTAFSLLVTATVQKLWRPTVREEFGVILSNLQGGLCQMHRESDFCRTRLIYSYSRQKSFFLRQFFISFKTLKISFWAIFTVCCTKRTVNVLCSKPVWFILTKLKQLKSFQMNSTKCMKFNQWNWEIQPIKLHPKSSQISIWINVFP